MRIHEMHANTCVCWWCGGKEGNAITYRGEDQRYPRHTASKERQDQEVPVYQGGQTKLAATQSHTPDDPEIENLCGLIIGYIKEITEKIREESKMKLPAVQNGRAGKTITKLPDAQNSGGGSSYLKAADIAAKGITSIIFNGNLRESTGQYGAGIDTDVKIGKKEFTFTVKFASGNYSRLLARFGSNPAKWKGKVKVCRAQHLGKDYVQVVD